MTLRELLGAVAGQAGFDATPPASLPSSSAAAAVSSVAYDSRAVKPGAVFVALRGQHADGAAFARDAVARGALLVVAESPAPAAVPSPWLQVADARMALAALAAAFYGHPSRELVLVGITGTNGKTTTAYLVSAMFEAAGMPCGRLGTIDYTVAGRRLPAARTTPEAPDLQAMLREMVTQGARACVIEVSSHALVLRRAEYLRFAAGVFTNLTRDHLDFHRSMEEYARAKEHLFELLRPSGAGIANLDDPRGAAFAAIAPRAVTFAIDAPADVRPESPPAYSLAGLDLAIATPRGAVRARSPLVGRPNVSNILAAVATGVALDLPVSAIEAGIAAVSLVPGRFQVVSAPQDDVRVVVDYAHTDDALKNLLETARPLAAGGRVITVFGCGGDRDATKRPLMGAVAARLSDLVIVTSDNPRSEDPERIIEDVKRGIVLPADRVRKGQPPPPSTPCLAIVDRQAAIERAVQEARPGDLVLVAGKGHEQTQTIGSRVLPFDDVDVARRALARRRTGRRAS